MAKVTLKSLAKGLNMSVSTVSKALNDSYEISEETKSKVKAYATAHNYQPNIIAQTLKTGKTNTIGVIIPKMSSPFESQIIEGIQEAATKENFRVVIMNSMENEAMEKSNISSMVAKGVDGILFCPIHEHSNINLVKQISENTPFVIFDRTNYAIDTHKIGVLNTEGTHAACQHLFDMGHRKVAILGGAHQGITADRVAGYKQAHKEADIPVQEEYIIYLNVKSVAELHEGLSRNIQKLRNLPEPPTAVVGISDTITTHSLGILSQLGIKVPQEIAVIGFANTDLAFSLNPSLSTIYQPAKDIGAISFAKVLAILNKKYRNQIEWEDIKLPTTIQLRESTKINL
ncbi:LacI family transcriptional regulator [Sphingobacterium psychroaquaticum]|uniref:LacI family DNA-binding transcriptional regulator n=1 Tax=Sphingobacterium psychroaquaticum TaxID=561061 RepID=UPI0010696F6A|nr:LacI family DNA-binding transcriptional regulator [Sphingobacterium psychroaquaticum]QBQ40132.1 LacI family transcriptional regulator [Sphingobacterium psychroaquaticum]